MVLSFGFNFIWTNRGLTLICPNCTLICPSCNWRPHFVQVKFKWHFIVIFPSYMLNSYEFELCVLEWYAKLWEIEKNEYWGYVTNGGTEGNLYAMLVGWVGVHLARDFQLSKLLIDHYK